MYRPRWEKVTHRLPSREWIATVSTWPSNFKYKDMAEVAVDLSKRLRDPEGEHKCDIIIALTHARLVITPCSVEI